MTDADTKKIYPVQVRELVEFAWRSGDLGGEQDFVSRDRALAGIRGHAKVQRSRPDGYRKEVPVTCLLEADGFAMRIQGRIDGVVEREGGVIIEEIKTVLGRWTGAADPLHWAQVKIYAHIYAEQNALAEVDVRLVYLHLETGQLAEFSERWTRAGLAEDFAATTRCYLDWLCEWHRWCQLRTESIRAMEFPMDSYRPGQRDLSVAVYRALTRNARLFIEAPTGLGKTMAVVFPALKAMGEGKLERLFYLTARTTGRSAAEKAFGELREAGLRLRMLTLTAKEKVCVREGGLCDPLGCPMALGYYDRRRGAMREALARERITRPVLEEVAARHQTCPFELALDLSTWVDAIVCDYNYVFDPQVYLRRHFGEGGNAYGFLIDEAHNLVERAREMFSAQLETGRLRAVGRETKAVSPRLARALGRLSRVMRQVAADGNAAEEPVQPSGGEGADLFDANPDARTAGPAATEPAVPSGTRFGGEIQATVLREIPESLASAVAGALDEAERWLARNEPAPFREGLLEVYFALLRFQRTAEQFDERSVVLAQPGPPARVRLFCVDPSTRIRGVLERGSAAVFFSATLTPPEYYRTLLGGGEADAVVQLASPFPPEHFAVLVDDHVETRLKARDATLAEVAKAVGALVRGRRGNYLVYLPSYEYLRRLHQEFTETFAGARVLLQHPGMTEPERDAFLAEFVSEHEETLVGFAVLGGVFGEGIDLVGERLVGAVIVGVGLPQLCIERDLIRDYFARHGLPGFEYAYTFPGMNRVLQAIGRVIRSERDRGVALLIDARFAEWRYRRLFPRWWRARRARGPEVIQRTARAFWATSSGVTRS